MQVDKEKIDYYASNIAQEIIDMPSFNISEITEKLKVRIGFVIKDILKSQINDLEKYRTELTKEYAHSTTHAITKNKLQAEIIVVNDKLKTLNKSSSEINRHNDYQLLRHYCREKLPKEFLQEFYKLQESLR